MSSIIEFNGKKYDSLTGRILSSHKQDSSEMDAKKIFPSESKSMDGISHKPKKIEVKSEFDTKKSEPIHRVADKAVRQTVSRKHRVERPKTLMRTAVKKTKHTPEPEHKPPARAGLYHEFARERARRAKHIQKSASIAKFSKTASKRRSDITFSSKPLPVAVQPPPPREITGENSIVTQAEQLVGKLEDAVQSAESHLEVYADKKLRSKRSRQLAYALATVTSIFLISFAVYQATPFVRVKMASNKAGFAATLPGYVPNGYGLEDNLKADSGEVTLTYSSESAHKNYEITQTPSKWNSDSLLNNYVLPASIQYERLDENGQIIYLYDGQQSATWLDNGIWYRLNGANNFSNDQLLRIVKGL